eukprot:COSAG06_NODE_89_length_24874_cov_50.509344_6_plen_105_part_00
MALGCSVLRCFLVSVGVTRAPVSQQLRPTNGLGHARRRLHRSDCLAHVEGPAPARGLELSGWQIDSVGRSQRRGAKTSNRGCERFVSVDDVFFSLDDLHSRRSS